MLKQDFSFDLPKALIADKPLAKRSASRLLCLDENGQINHHVFTDIINYCRAGDVLVCNNTKVIPARVFGHKQTGGQVELLLERLIDNKSAWVHIKASKAPKPGTILHLDGDKRVTVLARDKDLFQIEFEAGVSALDYLETYGHMPLPPYIERADDEQDRARYQTVYAKHAGAVAAPTAGLHFDEALLQQLQDKGVQIAYVTLHVGAGTFQPVRVDNIEEHHMHSEYLEVSAETCAVVNQARQQGGRIIAVGTTSVRCLESATEDDELKPFQGETDIFIYPGYTFKMVDMLITNFHLPESTLIMLVTAFAGFAPVMAAYREAVAKSYRFFSYGDAMLLLKPA